MLVSIVIPVYNTVRSLPKVARKVDDVFSRLPEHDYELIFVDDCSSNPDTWPTLEQLAQGTDKITAIQLTRNFGQQGATLCGCSYAGGDVVVTMDDDLQHDPEDIPLFLQRADHDIVIGQFLHKKHSLFKRATSWIKGWFDYYLIGRPKGMHSSSFRMFSRTVAQGLLLFRTPNPFVPALLFHISKDIVGVPVGHAPRTEGRSGYTLGKMIRLFSNLIINNSSFLLRVFAYLGIFISGASLIMFFVVLYKKIVLGVAIQGWASLMATILLLGGMLMLIMGLMGEYLLRAIQSSEGNPPYYVRRVAGTGTRVHQLRERGGAGSRGAPTTTGDQEHENP